MQFFMIIIIIYLFSKCILLICNHLYYIIYNINIFDLSFEYLFITRFIYIHIYIYIYIYIYINVKFYEIKIYLIRVKLNQIQILNIMIFIFITVNISYCDGVHFFLYLNICKKYINNFFFVIHF